MRFAVSKQKNISLRTVGAALVLQVVIVGIMLLVTARASGR
ncbi:hypothetical protein ACNKHV_13770 [Shigella flexneri]